MTETVVHALEMIDVGEDDRGRLTFASAAGKFSLQSCQYFGTIQQAGQEIVRGGESQRLLEFQDALARDDAGS